MFSEKVNLLKIEIASHFGQIWPALSMWVKGVLNGFWTLRSLLRIKQNKLWQFWKGWCADLFSCSRLRVKKFFQHHSSRWRENSRTLILSLMPFFSKTAGWNFIKSCMNNDLYLVYNNRKHFFRNFDRTCSRIMKNRFLWDFTI